MANRYCIQVASHVVTLSSLALVFSWSSAARAQTPGSCNVTNYSYSETFTAASIDANKSSPGWDTHLGSARLNSKSGSYNTNAVPSQFTYAATVPALAVHRLVSVVTGDFNGDGSDDVIALNATPACQLDFLPNSATLLGGVFSAGVKVSDCTTRIGVSMATGDVDGDGRLDIVMASVADLMQGNIAAATIYRNASTSIFGRPVFVKYDITALLQADGVTWHASGSTIALDDNDGDGRDDLFVLSSGGSASRVLLYTSSSTAPYFRTAGRQLVATAGLAGPMATAGSAPFVGYGCVPDVGPSAGGTVLAVEDFDQDGNVDFIVGSVSDETMTYFQQNNDGSFTRMPDIILDRGGPLLAWAKDVDRDGTPDLVFLRSGNACDGTPGEGYVLYNDGLGNMNLTYSRVSFGHSLSFGGVSNWKNSTPKSLDIIAGRHNGAGIYSVYKNSTSGTVYTLRSVTTSKNLSSALNPTLKSIVSVTINTYTPTVPAGTSLALQMSNDGGVNWESFTAQELAGTPHAFTHYGADLRWRVTCTGNPASLTGTNATFSPGSLNTPSLGSFGFTYSAVDAMSYSRSAPSTGVANSNDLLFSADFIYPGYYGELYAYNVQTLNANTASRNSLQTVSGGTAGVSWEAGRLLAARSGSSRSILFSSPASTSASIDPIVVPMASTALTGSDTSLATLNAQASTLAASLGVAGVSTTPAAGTFAFIANGFGNTTASKMRDPGHASPVFVGAPAADPNYAAYSANAYGAWKTANASRAPMVYMGANDGMLHAFNAASGAETYALVPFNLTSQFAAQAKFNSTTSAFTYQHKAGIDGTPDIEDIYAGGAWRTVAVGGQGEGLGIGNNGYYYGVDVTNPNKPVPLWEFSDILKQPITGCSLDNNSLTTCTPTCTPSSTCVVEDDRYDSFFRINPTTGGRVNAFTNIDDGDCEPDFSYCYFFEFSFLVTNGAVYYPQIEIQLDSRISNNSYNGEYSSFDNGPMQFHRGTSTTALTWITGTGTYLAPGEHTMQIVDYSIPKQNFMRYVAVTPYKTSPSPSTAPSNFETTCEQTCTPVCTATTYTSPSTTPWPQCGSGANQQCCGSAGGDQYCAPTGASCSLPETSQGQTLSTPTIGRLATSTGGVWAAFFGSGSNARSAPNVGRALYAVDAYTGKLLAQWTMADIPFSANNPSTIDNTVPGSVGLIDVDNDGFVDRAYVGDLEGRMWKIDLSKVISASGALPSDYPMCVLFDAGNPEQTGTRTWAPISMKPAVMSMAANKVNVYFGTGGDDRSPQTLMYKFYSVQDDDARGSCRSTPKKESILNASNYEWVVGDGKTNTAPQTALSGANINNEGVAGEHFWADPLIVDNSVVYFSSLPGKIESVDACTPSAAGQSKIYGYALSTFTDSAGTLRTQGTSVLDGVPYVSAYGKVRRAAIQRNGSQTAGNAHGQGTITNKAQGDVFFQSFTGSSGTNGAVLQRLATPGTRTGKARLRTLRWREVPL